MAWLAVGAGILLLVLWLARLFANARVETIRKAGLGVLAVLAGVLVLALVLSGRAGQLVWSAAVFAPLLWRWAQARLAAYRFRRGDAGGRAGESTVETATLVMRLDHATGEMQGEIRRGPQAGRSLGSLSLAEVLGLLAACRAEDPDSVPLLEAWLDRLDPDWRSAEAARPPPGGTGPGGSGGGGPMTRAEALAILGLEEGATPEAIRAAHRRLMRAAHPDHGGSDWLAARVNQARDVLLP